ncbi:MAG: AzlC family ABC transporter permease [Hyphomicrobiales bacterium]
MTAEPEAFASTRAAWQAGMLEALGVPAAVLAAGYIGFGALAFDADFSLALALFSTLTIWALPGQIAFIELRELGTAAPALVLAVMLTSARFLPMTVTLLPMLRHPAYRSWHYYLAGHFVAMTGWAVAVRRCPMLPLEQRLPYFLGFAIGLWLACMVGTAVGYLASGMINELATLGLVFLNPVYFILILGGEVRHRQGVLALLCGAFAGPLMQFVTPQWALLVAGILGGTLAFAVDRAWGKKA